MTDFPDWQAPQAHATAISVTGAPPLVFKQVIDALIGQNVAAASSVTRPASGQFSLNQPGYEIALNVATLGATAPVVSVELQWYDFGFGQLIDDETYYFYSGNLNGHLIHGRGPSKGDRVVVIITNYSSASAVTVSYTLLQTSRTFTREFWKTLMKAHAAPVFPGFTAATMNIAANVLSAESHSLGAGVTNDFVLPLYTGTVRMFGFTTDTVAGNSKWKILDNTDQVANAVFDLQASNGQSGFAPLGASSLWLPTVTLPRSQCTLELVNNGSGAQTLSTTVVAQEDRT